MLIYVFNEQQHSVRFVGKTFSSMCVTRIVMQHLLQQSLNVRNLLYCRCRSHETDRTDDAAASHETDRTDDAVSSHETDRSDDAAASHETDRTDNAVASH